MLEDDSTTKYIYKLQRHYKFQVAGWNHFAEIEPTVSNSHRLAFAAAIDCVRPIQREGQVPLEVLSWDIEVSTESGKFDSNAYNPLNRIVCICFTVGSAMVMGKSRRQVCIIPCDGPKSSITGEQGECIEVIPAGSEIRMI